MIQATQTVPEAQRRCPQWSVQSITKTLQLTLQATIPARVPAPTAQLAPSAVTQFQGKPQVAYSQESLPPVPHQSPSHASRLLPQFNPKQPSATQFVTPHTDRVLISQTVTPVTNSPRVVKTYTSDIWESYQALWTSLGYSNFQAKKPYSFWQPRSLSQLLW